MVPELEKEKSVLSEIKGDFSVGEVESESEAEEEIIQVDCHGTVSEQSVETKELDQPRSSFFFLEKMVELPWRVNLFFHQSNGKK